MPRTSSTKSSSFKSSPSIPPPRPSLPIPSLNIPQKKTNILLDSLVSGVGFSFGNMIVKKLFENSSLIPSPETESDNCVRIIENYKNCDHSDVSYQKYTKCMNESTKKS
jgi:hypothetical protein